MLQAAKEHFGCSDLKGIYLENEGSEESAGSHFEKLHFGNELMTPSKTGRPVISRILLAFFEDTSWYKVDYSLTDQYYWGRDNGCDFFNEKCENFPEFCNVVDNINCTPDYLGKSACSLSTYSDSCNYNEYFREYNCENIIDFVKTSYYEETGPTSRCFDLKL